MKKVDIIWSETWLKDDLENIEDILNEVIKDFVEKDETVINIECKTSPTGLSRFWIYIVKND